MAEVALRASGMAMKAAIAAAGQAMTKAFSHRHRKKGGAPRLSHVISAVIRMAMTPAIRMGKMILALPSIAVHLSLTTNLLTRDAAANVP